MRKALIALGLSSLVIFGRAACNHKDKKDEPKKNAGVRQEESYYGSRFRAACLAKDQTASSATVVAVLKELGILDGAQGAADVSAEHCQAAVAKLPALTSLNLVGYDLESLAPIVHFHKLVGLDLSENPRIRKDQLAVALRGLAKLRTLGLTNALGLSADDIAELAKQHRNLTRIVIEGSARGSELQQRHSTNARGLALTVEIAG